MDIKRLFKRNAPWVTALMLSASCMTQKFDKYGVSQVPDPSPKEVEALIHNPATQFYKNENGVLYTQIVPCEDNKNRGLKMVSYDHGITTLVISTDIKALKEREAYAQGVIEVQDGYAGNKELPKEARTALKTKIAEATVVKNEGPVIGIR